MPNPLSKSHYAFREMLDFIRAASHLPITTTAIASVMLFLG